MLRSTSFIAIIILINWMLKRSACLCEQSQMTSCWPCVVVTDVVKQQLEVASDAVGHHLCDARQRTRNEKKRLFCTQEYACDQWHIHT